MNQHCAYEHRSYNGNSALQHFERSNMVKICNGIMYDFYPRLPHVVISDIACIGTSDTILFPEHGV